MIDIQISKSPERKSRQTLSLSRSAFTRESFCFKFLFQDSSERNRVKELLAEERERKRERERERERDRERDREKQLL